MSQSLDFVVRRVFGFSFWFCYLERAFDPEYIVLVLELKYSGNI